MCGSSRATTTTEGFLRCRDVADQDRNAPLKNDVPESLQHVTTFPLLERLSTGHGFLWYDPPPPRVSSFTSLLTLLSTETLLTLAGAYVRAPARRVPPRGSVPPRLAVSEPRAEDISSQDTSSPTSRCGASSSDSTSSHAQRVRARIACRRPSDPAAKSSPSFDGRSWWWIV